MLQSFAELVRYTTSYMDGSETKSQDADSSNPTAEEMDQLEKLVASGYLEGRAISKVHGEWQTNETAEKLQLFSKVQKPSLLKLFIVEFCVSTYSVFVKLTVRLRHL